MKRLLQRGTYNGGQRPSEHQVGHQSFLADNGGAIPPNVLVSRQPDEPEATLVVANTGSNGAYQRACRAAQVKRHPARMPEGLVEFFVRFLTDPGDLVLDPFAGSNTTGAVAETLGRRWLAVERDPGYALASQARFAAPAARAA
jgi:site-specific DNA-methyltransferase (cytosine-N4-specific)